MVANELYLYEKYCLLPITNSARQASSLGRNQTNGFS
jgi:hypothetical protein